MQEMEVDSWAGTARSITVHAAQTVTDFADASHSESAKSITITVLYGIFSLENSYPSQQLKCNDNKFSCCENMRKQI